MRLKDLHKNIISPGAAEKIMFAGFAITAFSIAISISAVEFGVFLGRYRLADKMRPQKKGLLSERKNISCLYCSSLRHYLFLLFFPGISFPVRRIYLK